MDENQPLSCNSFYLLKQTSRTVKAFVSRLLYKIDVNTLHREQADTLTLNEIGRVELRTSLPLFFDSYNVNRGTGNFVLIDPVTQNTVASGMIRGAVRHVEDLVEQPHQHISKPEDLRRVTIPLEQRESRNNHKAAVIWLTGYSGAGKSTIGERLEQELFAQGCQTILLDTEVLDRFEESGILHHFEEHSVQARHLGEMARVLFGNGQIVLCPCLSPFEADRNVVRSMFPKGRFFEVHVNCDLAVCKRRDPHGWYTQTTDKELPGISSPYEVPKHPECLVETDLQSLDDILNALLQMLKEHGILKAQKE
jgi:bifunctional enzyme CysN/CysC